jgi:hypothetical protein
LRLSRSIRFDEAELSTHHAGTLKANFRDLQARIILRQSCNQLLDHLVHGLLALIRSQHLKYEPHIIIGASRSKQPWPVVLTSRPWCWAIFGSTSSARIAFEPFDSTALVRPYQAGSSTRRTAQMPHLSPIGYSVKTRSLSPYPIRFGQLIKLKASARPKR